MEFILLATAHFLALLSPGPDFFLILQASLNLRRRYGLALCAGIATANGVYLLLAVLGFLVIQEMAWLSSLLRYLGALYLLWLGILLLASKGQDLESSGSQRFLRVERMGRQFLVGFMSGVLNPKNMIFYLSLFTVMVAADTGALQRSLYALWMVMVVLLWDSLLVIILSRRSVKKILGQGVFWVEKTAGLALVSFALVLPFA